MSTPLDDYEAEEINRLQGEVKKLSEDVASLMTCKLELEDRLLKAIDENKRARKALGVAVMYIESLRVVPGGVRDRLRTEWRAVLGWP